MVKTYVRPPPMMAKGEGSHLWDIENRRYLDFTAGIAVNSLGHADPEISKLLYQQSQTLIHSSNLYHNPWTGALCQLLIENTLQSGAFQTVSRAFISNSGSEANEAALKFCRKVGRQRTPPSSPSSPSKRSQFVTFHNSFHGRTMGSLSATPNPKYQAPFSPLIPGFSYLPYNCTTSLLEKSITDNTCGVLVEPIQGEGGINVADPSFLRALRKRCNEVGAVLVYDEIQSGLSRTGALWAHNAIAPNDTTIQPDVLTTAKALGNGFPVAATLVSEPVAEAIVTGDHGTTFGGNPLACRIAHHILGRLSSPDIQSAVLKKSIIFQNGFERLRQRFPDLVKETRGMGLILGLQLSRDPTPIVTAARELGLLVITAGTNTLRFLPPLIIEEEEIKTGLDILERAIEKVEQAGVGVEGTKGQQEMAPPGR
ncbi:acetylornithine aminotransferase [Bacidia gigantensis]|uniref:acetylornithine aminotransferase n=1 Tax=Bacidia gigantensis TaxID=2732470 RepID=UPI001D045955|nr:acetylornithine aminotransferase [Bacidia gigantensis]KAG8531238.1 acetylornithine aminotransferase [Bacidia gigantensis]